MNSSRRRRSNEPIFWSLFGAGGVLTALILPVTILITGILVPLGLTGPEVMSYARMQAFVDGFIGKVLVWSLISLTLWHALHRVYHGLHDLGVDTSSSLYKWLAYGSAFVGTVVVGLLVLSVGAA